MKSACISGPLGNPFSPFSFALPEKCFPQTTDSVSICICCSGDLRTFISDHVPHSLSTGGPQLSTSLPSHFRFSARLWHMFTFAFSCFLTLICIVYRLPGHMKDALENLHKADRIYIDIKLFLQGDVDLAENPTGELRASLNKLKCIKPMPQME